MGDPNKKLTQQTTTDSQAVGVNTSGQKLNKILPPKSGDTTNDDKNTEAFPPLDPPNINTPETEWVKIDEISDKSLFTVGGKYVIVIKQGNTRDFWYQQKEGDAEADFKNFAANGETGCFSSWTEKNNQVFRISNSSTNVVVPSLTTELSEDAKNRQLALEAENAANPEPEYDWWGLLSFVVDIVVDIAKDATGISLLESVIELGEAILEGDVDKIIDAAVNVARNAVPVIDKAISVVETAKDVYEIATEKDPEKQKQMATDLLVGKITEKIADGVAKKAEEIAEKMQNSLNDFKEQVQKAQQQHNTLPNPENNLPTVIVDERAKRVEENKEKVKELKNTLPQKSKAYSASKIPAKDAEKIEIPNANTIKPENTEPIDISGLREQEDGKEKILANNQIISSQEQEKKKMLLPANEMADFNKRIPQDPNNPLRKDFEILIRSKSTSVNEVAAKKADIKQKLETWEKENANDLTIDKISDEEAQSLVTRYEKGEKLTAKEENFAKAYKESVKGIDDDLNKILAEQGLSETDADKVLNAYLDNASVLSKADKAFAIKYYNAKSRKNTIRKGNKLANQVQDYANQNNKALQAIQASNRKCTIIQENDTYTFIDLDLNAPIGFFTQRSDGYIEIAMFRKEYPDTKMRGKEVFASLIENHNQRGISFKGIRGTWSGKDSDNRTEFNQFIAAGFSKEEAATKTWTGQRAKDFGYKKVTIVQLEPDQPPYTSILVNFDK